jgi:hypothetical protein
MRRRGGWRGKRWRELENRNWKIENGKRVGGTAFWRAVFAFWGDGREEDYAEYAEDAECAEERKTRTLKTAGCGTHRLLWILFAGFSTINGD